MGLALLLLNVYMTLRRGWLTVRHYQLSVFLDDEAVALTNALAEQEIRPAVVMRKTSACNLSPELTKAPLQKSR